MGLFVSPHRRIDCGKLLSLGSNKPGKQTFHGLKCHVEKCQKDILYTWKIGVVACGGRGLSGRKWITRQSFFDSLSSASRRWTRKTSSYRGEIGWRSRDRREFYFLSRYFRFRPWCNTRSFRLSGWISALIATSERPACDCDRRTIAVGLGWETTSGRSLSVSGRSKMAPGADMEAEKSHFSTEFLRLTNTLILH